MDVLAEAAEKGQPIGGLKPLKSSRVPASTHTRAATSTSAFDSACSNIDYNTSKPPSGPGTFLSWSNVTNLGYTAGRELIKGWAGDTAAQSVEYMIGFALAKYNRGTDKTLQQINENFIAIGTKLDCILAQIGDLSVAITEIKLEIELEPMTSCISGINTEWENYQYFLATTPQNINSQNGFLSYMFDPAVGVTVHAVENCSSIINTSLFDTSGGKGGAWVTNVSKAQDKKVGGNTVKMLNVFFPSDIYQLQLFLTYYSTVEYQQMILQSEVFNWNVNILEKDQTDAARQTMYGPTCNTSSIPKNPPIVKGNAGNFCDWQLNIAGVWPQSIFSDEVALCTECDKPGMFPLLTGYAIVAVPAKLSSDLISPHRDVKQGERTGGLGSRTGGHGSRNTASLANQDCDVITSPSTMCSSITLTVAPATSVAEDSAANLIFTFSRSGSTSGSLIVNFTVGGSATVGTDYTYLLDKKHLDKLGSVTFAAGYATATVILRPSRCHIRAR